MNKISQTQLLSAVFRKVFGRKFGAESLEDRIILQKTIFLMHEQGVSCGDYEFVWDLYGPFCPSLSDDMKRPMEEEIPVHFNQYAEKIMEKLNETFLKEGEYEMRYWVEAIASLYYLREYMYPSATQEEVIGKLEKIKSTMCNHEQNVRAMEALDKILAV